MQYVLLPLPYPVGSGGAAGYRPGGGVSVDYGKPGQVKDANKASKRPRLSASRKTKGRRLPAVTLLTKEPEKAAVNQNGARTSSWAAR